MSEDLFVIEDYEYGVQYKYGENTEWRMNVTNHFQGWYPSEKSAKNALAQVKAPRYGYYATTYEYRLVRRPVGRIEVVQ